MHWCSKRPRTTTFDLHITKLVKSALHNTHDAAMLRNPFAECSLEQVPNPTSLFNVLVSAFSPLTTHSEVIELQTAETLPSEARQDSSILVCLIYSRFKHSGFLHKIKAFLFLKTKAFCSVDKVQAFWFPAGA
jgi:hypothetical protein